MDDNNFWKCKCGRENSIIDRYCVYCSEEIPQEYIDKIAKEEIAAVWRDLRDRANEKWKKGAKARYEFCVKTYKPGVVGFILSVATITLVVSNVQSGVITAQMLLENIFTICFAAIYKAGDILSLMLEIIAKPLDRLFQGSFDLIVIHKEQFETVSKTSAVLTERVGSILKEVSTNIEKLNALERIKGFINGFIK